MFKYVVLVYDIKIHPYHSINSGSAKPSLKFGQTRIWVIS